MSFAPSGGLRRFAPQNHRMEPRARLITGPAARYQSALRLIRAIGHGGLMKHVFGIVMCLAIGVVWIRLLSKPLCWLFGKFVRNRLTQLVLSGITLAILLPGLTVLAPTRHVPKESAIARALMYLVFIVPCVALWVVLEYRYGCNYKEYRQRMRIKPNTALDDIGEKPPNRQ